MKRYNLSLDNIVYIKEGITLCLGYFDGLHLGHLSLIKKAVDSSYKSAVLSFATSNNLGLKRSKILTTLDDRESLLSKIVDYFIVLPFDEELKKLSPEEFIEKILRPLNVKKIIVGEDFTFGYKAKGNVKTLQDYKEKFYDLEVLPSLIIEGQKVSTSLIIDYLNKGDIKKANALLGREYVIRGKVIKGFENGRKINYKTANIDLEDNYVIPKQGVYRGISIIANKEYLSMINVGVHPTINPLAQPLVESHLFDFDSDIYGLSISVKFLDYIREEKKFNDLEDLKLQLQKDEALIRSMD